MACSVYRFCPGYKTLEGCRKSLHPNKEGDNLKKHPFLGDVNMPVQIGTKASSLSDPVGLMSDCHRRIEMFLKTLRAVGELNGRQLSEDERRSL
jgi:hypothetical protein